MSPLLVFANLLYALIAGWVLLGVGARLRRVMGLAVPPGLGLPVDFCLGAWAAATLFLVLALVGITQAVVFVAASLCLVVVARWKRSSRRWSPVLWASAGGTLSLPVAAGPPFFYDAMVYHLGLPWQVLVEGGAHAHPENLFAAFPPLAQLIALPPLALGLDRVPALLHWFSFIAAAAAVQALARASGASTASARAAGIASLLVPAAAAVPGFPAAEGWFMAGLLSAIAVSFSANHRGTALLTGVLLGIASAARLQGITWTVLVLGLMVWRQRSWRSLVVSSGAWLVGALPWWLKNWILLHDPTAPVLWRREGMETLWRDAGALRLQGLSIIECLAQLPARIGAEAITLVPLALVAVFSIRAGRRPRHLGVIALCALVLWLTTGALPRFLTPIFLLLLVMAASVARTRLAALAAIVAIVWCATIGAWRTAGLLGAVHPAERFFQTTAEATAGLLPNDPLAAYREAQDLPPDARVLLVAEPRCYGFPREFVAPSQHDPSPLRGLLDAGASPQEVTAGLRDDGFTHLLVNWAELERLASSYPVSPWHTQTGRQRWIELVRSMQPPVVTSGSVRVYALEPL